MTSPRRSAKSIKKSLLCFGGRYISATKRGSYSFSANNCSSKLLYLLEATGRQENMSLYMEAKPPPRPVVRGELKNKQFDGSSSEKELKSPVVSQVSVRKRKSK